MEDKISVLEWCFSQPRVCVWGGGSPCQLFKERPAYIQANELHSFTRASLGTYKGIRFRFKVHVTVYFPVSRIPHRTSPSFYDQSVLSGLAL